MAESDPSCYPVSDENMAEEKVKLMIVDGHAVLHRAWHALPPLSTRAGQVISGAYGFTSTLLNAIRRFQPTHLAVTFDLKGKTFRHHEFEAYKATRVKQPEEFYSQIPITEKILRAMGIGVYTAQGFEADDVIATITEQAKRERPDVDVIIVTGDLDTLQLVDDRTRIFTMRKGMSDLVIYDKQAVADRYGLRPDQMVDYKALRGDPSDNIPGVKGIGEVTATELIGRFGSVESLYRALESGDKHALELKPSVREKLVAHKKEALQARELCRLRRDAPIDFSLDKNRYQPVTKGKVAAVFEEYQFAKLLQQFPEDQLSMLPAAAPSAATEQAIGEQTKSAELPVAEVKPQAQAPVIAPAFTISDKASLAKSLDSLGQQLRLAMLTVTETDDPLNPGFLALALADGQRSYVIGRQVVEANKKLLGKFFTAAKKKPRMIICHDLKKEINVWQSLGLDIDGPFLDLMIASYLAFSGLRRHSLGSLLSYFYDLPPEDPKETTEDKIAILSKKIGYFLPLSDELEKELEQKELTPLNQRIELPLVPVLARMERTGIAVDIPYLKKLSKDFSRRINGLEATIHELAGSRFNVNSPQQVQAVLFDKLGLSAQGLKKTVKGRTLSTAASELEKLRGQHPIIDAILAYRELAKLKSTYVDTLPELADPGTGRVHASFNQTVTATGRLSSSDPNLQNIPTTETEHGRMVRNGFIATRGYRLLSADYSQIELRIAAHLAKEKTMIEAFRKGEDIHWRTAVEMWGEAEAEGKRRLAKVINFGILYGMGPQRLAGEAGISPVEAREFIDRYFAVHPGLAEYMDGIREKMKQDGFVQTLFGRRRFFQNYGLMNAREKAEAERQGINMPIQGTQADMIKMAMVDIDALIRRKYGDPDQAPVRMLIQVHDELIFEVRHDLVSGVAKDIAGLMAGVCRLDVPVVVNLSVGRRWGEMKPLE